MREVTYRYRDPLDVVWLDAAARIGLRIERSDDCYASTDGAGTLFIGSAAHLDADDSLSQMIFHELCHSLIEGPESFDRPDWDLDNETDRDLDREYACLRLQAALAATHGLRQVFAPTTDHRAFYDRLPADPFSPRTDPSSILALRGAARVGRPPWGPHLAQALVATQRIAEAVGAAAMGASGLLWSRFEAPIPPHPSGLEGAFADQGRCGDCAWQRRRGPGKAVPRCEQGGGVRVEVAWPGCARWEPEPSCLECGACCREAYGAVEVSARDPFVRLHPDLLTKRPRGYEIRREGERCAALQEQPPRHAEDADEADTASPSYMCVVYEDRPRTCRDFTRGSEHCLTARRRVGLSR
ncbi:MAG: YkgJ family cysteine cluster protein [Deltaproteobacteria bacterium]|nr:YkgJ family cysteine cluster protein [Deltaproteobacteria bacterium]